MAALFEPMPWFCNACGTKQNTLPSQAMGRDWRVCSKECLHEIRWRESLSVMGKEYYPRPVIRCSNSCGATLKEGTKGWFTSFVGSDDPHGVVEKTQVHICPDCARKSMR